MMDFGVTMYFYCILEYEIIYLFGERNQKKKKSHDEKKGGA